MDFPSKEELIANAYNNEVEIAEALGADSVRYLSVEGMMDAVPQQHGTSYCTACFTGSYPVEIDTKASKLVVEE